MDRLEHINSGVIPRDLIKQKRKESIAKIVYEIITDDNKYGRYDRPVDDEQQDVDLMTNAAVDRMQAREVPTMLMPRRLKMFEVFVIQYRLALNQIFFGLVNLSR